MPTLFYHPWLFEVLEEYKFQITNIKSRVSGVGCQVSGKRNKKAET
jgi:hypothetical protein